MSTNRRNIHHRSALLHFCDSGGLKKLQTYLLTYTHSHSHSGIVFDHNFTHTHTYVHSCTHLITIFNVNLRLLLAPLNSFLHLFSEQVITLHILVFNPPYLPQTSHTASTIIQFLTISASPLQSTHPRDLDLPSSFSALTLLVGSFDP